MELLYFHFPEKQTRLTVKRGKWKIENRKSPRNMNFDLKLALLSESITIYTEKVRPSDIIFYLQREKKKPETIFYFPTPTPQLS